MNITITIQADNAVDLRKAILALSGMGNEAAAVSAPDELMASTVEEQEAEVAQRMKERQKAEKAAEKKRKEAEQQKAAEGAQAPEPDTDSNDGNMEDIPSDVELRALAAEKAKRAGKAEVKALLDKYGAPSVTAVPNESRIAFKRDLAAL